MSKKILSYLLLAFCVFGLESCKPGDKGAPAAAEQEWYRYISAFTSGIVSRRADIRVLFVNNIGQTGPAAPGLLEFSPGIEGTAEWKSPRELAFAPKAELKPGREYSAVLHVGKILKLPKDFARFAFKFVVIQPQMEISVDGLHTEDPERPFTQVLSGRLETADDEDGEPVEKILEADQEGRKLAIEWSHSMGKRLHYFTVKGVERGDRASEVRLAWDGAPIRVDNRGFRTVAVPALSDFELVSAEASSERTRHVLLRFSDPLARGQNLQGLIRVDDYPVTFEIEGNVVRVYSSREFMGTVRVTVSPGVRNALNRRLPRADTREVTFEVLRPLVRFVGKGAILPRKDRLTVPFEAVNLRSVQVTALQVFSSNMAQFLQVNELGGSEEMTRVGRYLWRRTVPLSDDPAVTGRVTRYDLDVTDLFRENPGSLFRLILTFNRGGSTYPCPPSDKPVVKEAPLRNEEGSPYDRYSNWDYAEEGYAWAHANWINRNNPCDDAYYNPRYNSQAAVGRNFLASNIGLVAKREAAGALHVVTTDIGTAQPLSGVRVRAFNFQNQPLGEAASDANGFAVLKLADPAYYLSAQSGNDIGYLRVSDNTALPMSHFDVGGEAVEKGLKGAIYGERGVWRPGDTLHLTFVLFDRDKVLPAGHPVSMELYSPQGRLVRTLRPERAVEPFYAFRAATDETAPTGNWKARVLVGGLTFSKTLKIETVVPNRLKVDLRMPGEVLKSTDLPFEASVVGQWLHGAPASNLKFDIAVRLSPRPTRFEKYPDFAFDDPATEYSGGEVATEAGLLDAQGRGRLKLDFDMGGASPGMLDAAFVTRVFEDSGDFSIDTVSLPFHPFDSYVGLRTPRGDDARNMLLTDRDHAVDIVSVDADGRPVSRDGLRVALYKVEWRWWWDRSGESLAQYVASARTRPLLSGEVSTRDGAGRWTFQIKYPDWGRYLVRVEDPDSGHASGKIIYIDWPGWAGRARDVSGPGATRLNFTADKPSYRVGEKATIFLPEAAQGRALVSIENGSSVLQKMWVPTQKGENRFEIALTREMTPNIYVHVTLLQPHRDKVSDTPIRLYGVLPVMVDDPATRLEPVFQTADEFRPREKFRVQVRESAGRPMTYTVAVVDEGLLGLTRFATPDLRAEFYRREALGVSTWDLFDEIAEAYGAELARILAIGGDEAAAGTGEERRPRRFPPVVLFDGPFELRAGATASHEFEMPQYFGAVRVMVVGGRDGAFGSAGKSVPVRRDLMALPTFPRVVRPGERVEMPVSVFVTNPAIKEVTVALETDAMFRVEGESAKTVAFAGPGDQTVSFTLTAADAVGPGLVRFRVRGGPETVEDSIAVPVLGSNPSMTQTTRLEVKPGQDLTFAVKPFGLENTNSVVVEASTVPPLNLEKRLEFLIRYPHGCLEQTLSTAFPQLYLQGLVRLDPDERKAVEQHIRAAVEKMGGFQLANGAFAYWPGQRDGHEWTTTYAGLFLLEAARLGYHVPAGILDKWKADQRMLANIWTTGGPDQQLIQAFRLYALALAREPDLGAMNRLRESEGLSNIAALELAAAFHVTGQTEAAADLAKRSDLKVLSYRDDSLTFGSEFRDSAMLVRSLVRIGRSDRVTPLVAGIVEVLGSDRWLSTQETAFGLMALAAYYGGTEAKPFRFRMGWDKGAPREIGSATLLHREVIPDFPAAGRMLVVGNPGDTLLYVNVYRRGVPPAGVEEPSAEGLSIDVRYLDMKLNPIAIEKVPQGTDIVAEIQVKNTAPTRRYHNNLALTHIAAAGFQIRNP
ncbi:MAG: hypothetical protein FJY79_07460, partial [Candidatus Aminicenantes bacterium]|nr:hypothetical protein [Candidatus Aminicenantes bacterium]